MSRSPQGPSPFRFILNRSRATAANAYLVMQPTGELRDQLSKYPKLLEEVWKALRETTPQDLIREGRVYTNGLHKLEPRELERTPAPGIANLLEKTRRGTLTTPPMSSRNPKT